MSPNRDTLDASGNIVSELRYSPWGETRYNSGNTPTRYQYTGQYSYTPDFGLYFYNARWYDPTLGRFAQPDSLIPEQSQGAQAWDRYAYVNNNPLKYTDPSGHWLETAWDILNIAWDIHEIRQDPGNLWNWGALVVDVGAALLPGVPAFAGVVSKGGRALARTDDILDMVRAVSWTERFAGASPEVMRGVERLAKLVENEQVPAQLRRGLAAELARAEEYFKAGKLQAVEAVIESGRVDLILVTGELVEVKYWRQNYAKGHIEDILGQVKTYQATGRPVILEFVQTKTDPITEAFIQDLLAAAREAGIPLTREQIQIIPLGGP
jgi:RHS repeat-associated protein